MSLELTFALATGFVAFLASLIRAAGEVERTQARIAKIQAQRDAQVKRIRRLVQHIMAVRAEAREFEDRRVELENECKEVEARYRRDASIDRKIYVLDDRRTPSDLTWEAMVVHTNFLQENPRARPDAIESWANGRRFLIWALDRNKAIEKLQTRYPERDGYRMTEIAEKVDETDDDQAGQKRSA